MVRWAETDGWGRGGSGESCARWLGGLGGLAEWVLAQLARLTIFFVLKPFSFSFQQNKHN